ncbi:MAG: dicarboxylate--CoA ligase PimA [Gammaproteobacteria bacterium]|nr:dicarboxylate--CoA ligase PimA [Gammaproteobacteria bacterium]
METEKQWPWEKSLPEDVVWQTPINTYPLPELFEKSVVNWSKNQAIEFLGRSINYEELGSMVRKAAKGLQLIGVKKGSRVAIMLPNCPAYVVLYWAILSVGGIVVNTNPLYARDELEDQLKDSEPDILATLDIKDLFYKAEAMFQNTSLKYLVTIPFADELPAVKGLIFRLVKWQNIAKIKPNAKIITWKNLLANDGNYHKPVIEKSNIAVLQYTGGTTGVPKAAMLTHKNLSANIEQGTLFFPQTIPGKEIVLCVLPLFHVFAMTVVMNFSIRNGAEMILLPRFDLKQMLKTIARKNPTFFPAVPTIYIAINRDSDVKSGKYDLSSIKACLSGGDTLPLEVKNDFEKTTGCSLVEGYGLSETSPIAACNPSTGQSRVGSLGLPAPQTIIEITDTNERGKLMPQGKIGEICISGPQIMEGYWKNETATAKALEGGRFHTGDIGYIDKDGYVYLIDRMKEVIISSGYNIYPRYIEEAIYKHPAVEEVIVIGIDDSYSQQKAKAFIKLADNKHITSKVLLDFLSDKLSPIEIPKVIEFRDELPKTVVGKLSKKELIAEEKAKKEK